MPSWHLSEMQTARAVFATECCIHWNTAQHQQVELRTCDLIFHVNIIQDGSVNPNTQFLIPNTWYLIPMHLTHHSLSGIRFPFVFSRNEYHYQVEVFILTKINAVNESIVGCHLQLGDSLASSSILCLTESDNHIPALLNPSNNGLISSIEPADFASKRILNVPQTSNPADWAVRRASMSSNNKTFLGFSSANAIVAVSPNLLLLSQCLIGLFKVLTRFII